MTELLRSLGVVPAPAAELLARALAGPGEPKADWLRASGWVAVPVESACHFEESDAEPLADALGASGQATCWAVPTEPLAEVPAAYSVVASPEGLLEFSRACAHFNFALVAQDLSGLVLCTVHDYYLVCGTPAFVRRGVGELREAWERFRRFAASDARLAALERRLRERGS